MLQDPVFQDFLLRDYQRRFEKSLHAHHLFNAGETVGSDYKNHLAGQWINVKGALRLVWSLGNPATLPRELTHSA